MRQLPASVGRAVPLPGPAETSHRTLAGLLAFLPAAAMGLVRVTINAPVGPAVPAGIVDGVALAAVLGPALAAGVLTLETDGILRVGLAFAAGFGALSIAGTRARIPAAVALVGAAWVVAWAQARNASRTEDWRPAVVALALAGGLTLSMGSYLGLEPGITRGVGSSLALLALAASPAFVDWTRSAVVAGAGAGLTWLAVGLIAPFVAGAIALVVGGVVGGSLVLQALGIVGTVTVAGTGLHRGETDVALAGATLLAVGVPATVPRALAVIVAVGLLVVSEP